MDERSALSRPTRRVRLNSRPAKTHWHSLYLASAHPLRKNPVISLWLLHRRTWPEVSIRAATAAVFPVWESAVATGTTRCERRTFHYQKRIHARPAEQIPGSGKSVLILSQQIWLGIIWVILLGVPSMTHVPYLHSPPSVCHFASAEKKGRVSMNLPLEVLARTNTHALEQALGCHLISPGRRLASCHRSERETKIAKRPVNHFQKIIEAYFWEQLVSILRYSAHSETQLFKHKTQTLGLLWQFIFFPLVLSCPFQLALLYPIKENTTFTHF